jgi:inorganic triphosphatase YgiF
MVAESVPSEIEAKLLAPDEAVLEAIARCTSVGPFRLHPRDTVALHSVYLDTRERTLARHGVALRLRRTNHHWEVTVKWGGHTDGDLHERPELTVPLRRRPALPFRLPPGPLAEQLTALVAGRPLLPLLITDITRTRCDVRRARQRTHAPLAELALDRVHLRTPARRVPADTYYEVEAELRHGRPAEIAALARALRQRFGLRASPASKFARGLALVAGTELLDGADPGPVRRDDAALSALRRIVGRHLYRLRMHDPGTRLGADPEALHDMRVATRRLRAAFRSFRDALPPATVAHFRRELRWLGQRLGAMRDLDVQRLRLADHLAHLPRAQADALEAYRSHLSAERRRARAAMLAALASRRYARLLVRLERLSLVRDRQGQSRGVVATVARRRLKKTFRRLRDQGRRLGDRLDPADLHALRIRAKRVRYLLEFVSELTGKPGRRLVRRLVHLQDLLGAHQDAIVAAATVRAYAEGPGAESAPAVLLALGTLVNREQQRAAGARAKFAAAWRRLTRPRTQRDLEATLQRLKRTERKRT